MGGMSLIHWLLVGAVVLILFGGKGKISDIMGDVAKGVKAFKKGLADDEPASPARAAETPHTIEHQATTPMEASRDVNKVG
jgi:sec-independent protein translocase protein TatA